MTTGYTKRALKRDPNAPMGQPAAMHIDCGCGTTVPMPANGGATCPTCGITYDSAGWVTS